MSVKVRGTLEAVGTSKNGIYKSVKVNDVWYGCYKTDYSEHRGKTVEFFGTQTDKGFWNMDKDTLRVVEDEPAPAAAGGGGGPAPNDRQASIVIQSSYKSAAEVLSCMVAADALMLGSKKADKFDTMLGFLDTVAEHIYNKAMDPSSAFEKDEEAARYEEYSAADE